MADLRRSVGVKSEPHEGPAPPNNATPLTRLSLAGLRIAKRKRPETEDSTQEDGQETPSTQINGEPTRYAPLKRNRRVKEKTLSSTLGIAAASHYKPAKSYTGTRTNGETYSPTDLADLQYVVYLIGKCVSTFDNASEYRWGELRGRIHEMEVHERFNNMALIEKAKLLEDQGLPLLFSGEYEDRVPWDIAVDSSTLFKKWTKGDFDSSLLRGIAIDKKAKGTHYKLENNDDRVPATTVGDNGLVNGQWWPMRLCAFRDGAHGEREAGIYGKAGLGAYSIVLASGGYADKDHGDVIHYCGTESQTPTPTSRTSFLRSTVRKHAVRVLRGPNKKSTYAPSDGVRYDGLYNIVSEELLDKDKGMYRFKLERVPCQDPIRYKGVEKRPTKQQLDEKTRVWNTFARGA